MHGTKKKKQCQSQYKSSYQTTLGNSILATPPCNCERYQLSTNMADPPYDLIFDALGVMQITEIPYPKSLNIKGVGTRGCT